MKKVYIIIFLLFTLVGCFPRRDESLSVPTLSPSKAILPPSLSIEPTITITITPTLPTVPSITPTSTQIPISDYNLFWTLDDKVPARVVSLLFSSDSSLIVAGYNSYPSYDTGDNVIRIWRMENGCLKYKLVNTRGINWSLAISPDNSIVASSFWNVPEIQLWDLPNEVMLKRIETSGKFNKELRFSADGKKLFSVNDRFIEIRSLPDGAIMNSFEVDRSIRAMDVSSSGNFLVVSTYMDNDIFIWRSSDGELLSHVSLEDDRAYDEANVQVSFSKNEEMLAISHENQVSLWTVKTISLTKSFITETKYERFDKVIFSPDNRFLIALASVKNYKERTKIYVWDIQEGDLVKTFNVSGDPFEVTPMTIAMSPNGKFLANGLFGGKIQIYGSHKENFLRSCPTPTRILGNIPSPQETAVTPQISPYTWEFSSNNDTEGWTAWNQLMSLQVIDGNLVTKSTGRDPYMGSPKIVADAKLLSTIEVRMKVSEGGRAQFFFITNFDTWYDERKSLRFTPINDGQFHVYTLDMTLVEGWNGVITQLRFDPTSDLAEIEIDYIRLIAPD